MLLQKDGREGAGRTLRRAMRTVCHSMTALMTAVSVMRTINTRGEKAELA